MEGSSCRRGGLRRQWVSACSRGEGRQRSFGGRSRPRLRVQTLPAPGVARLQTIAGRLRECVLVTTPMLAPGLRRLPRFGRPGLPAASTGVLTLPGMPKATESPTEPRRFATERAFEAWLRKNHASCEGIWLLIAKPGAEQPTVTYPQALEAALCYGWIDGQKKALDDQHWLQRFTPRRPRSLWSKANRARAEALIRAGRMQPGGMAEVSRAKENGRWDSAYDGARAASVPPDLQAALDACPEARAFFASLDGANRYSVLWRVQTARKAETRSRRIETLVAMLARGEKIRG